MRTGSIAAIIAIMFAAPGCAVAGTAFVAADTAIGVTGAAVGAAGNVAEGAVRLAIPGDGEDEDEDRDVRRNDGRS